MINDSLWNADDFNLFEMEVAFMLELETTLELEIEEVMEVEDQMTSDKNFNMANSIEIKTETNQALKIESWMTDENVWNKQL